MSQIHRRYATVNGQQLFYREAGPSEAPALVLLHGFPTSSFMFRNLTPRLADRYHVIAPDHLGFGLSDAPPAEQFDYTFNALTDLTAGLLAELGITRYAIYVQDYGAPIGWRLALRDPGAITAIITQNGNGYDAGFVDSFWKPVWDYQRDQTPETETAVRFALTPEATRWQYLTGVADESLVSPDTNHVSFEADEIDVYLDGKQLALEPGQSVIAHGVDRGLDPDEIRHHGNIPVRA